jgi:hypothetical protein
MARNNFIPWVYVDDRGRGYITRALQEHVNQQTGDPAEPILGGRAPAGADLDFPPLPASVRPRQVYMLDPVTGDARYIRVFEADAPILTATPKPTLSVEDSGGTAHTMRFEHSVSEKFGRKASA